MYAYVFINLLQYRQAKKPQPVAVVRPVDYDWRLVIRTNLSNLANNIDPDGDLINELVRRGVIEEAFADTFTDTVDVLILYAC